MGAHPDRNAQFENIARLKAEYLAAGDPVISIDTKKKELLGDFAREGHTHTQVTVETLDHDFPSAGQGKLIPHGIYDVARNEGAIHLNTSHDTSDFCCDSIALWWQQQGSRYYSEACRLLTLCDGGGSNAANRHVFKEAYRPWPNNWAWQFASRTTRPSAQSTTPSSIACFHTSLVLARVWSFILSRLPNTLC